jgi:hypothetical protein
VLGDRDHAHVGEWQWPTLLVRQVKPLEPVDGAELGEDRRIAAHGSAPECARARV